MKSSKNERHGMESLTELYRIGRGPSSSHTIGPQRACEIFLKKYPNAVAFRAILYGSLAMTGKGHGTDTVIRKTFGDVPCEVVFDNKTKISDLPHPNTMDLIAYGNSKIEGKMRVLSVGGGRISIVGERGQDAPLVYRESSFTDISAVCEREHIRIPDYARRTEGTHIDEYIRTVWESMQKTIYRGLHDDGYLPGGLGVVKKAQTLYYDGTENEDGASLENRLVCAYAFAVGEQNACGETIVTAPTCGAAGVLPAVLYYRKMHCGASDSDIINALITAGIIGNLIKTNASISGAECGCQAEIGTACAMAASALSELDGKDLRQIEYAAEIAIEHHLGLTCDPIGGLVQIPCIERNAVAAMRAINAARISNFLSGTRKISLDSVIVTMRETGRDIACAYRETSEGGLAKTNRQLLENNSPRKR